MAPKFNAFGVPAPGALQHLKPPQRMEAIIERSLPKLPGWCTPFKGKRMGHLVMQAAPRASGAGKGPLCVELGVFGGRSLIALGLAVKHCLGGKGKVVGIDPYTIDAALEHVAEANHKQWWTNLNYDDIRRHAEIGIARLDLKSIVQLRIERSQDAAPSFGPESIDVLHQDSNHSEPISCGEVATWAPKMRAGGFWVFDDTNWNSTLLAQNFLLDLGFRPFESHDSWAVFQAPKGCGALQPVMPAFTTPEGYVEAAIAEVEGPPLLSPEALKNA